MMMNKIKQLMIYAARHFWPLFLVLLTGLVVTGNMTKQHEYLLKTHYLPLGTFSWEINTSNDTQKAVLNIWANRKETIRIIRRDTIETIKLTGIEVANSQNNADYGFIPFYVLFLCLLFARLAWVKPGIEKAYMSFNQALLFSILVVIAGILDVIENIGTANALSNYQQSIPAWHIALPSITKWLLLLIITVRLIITAIALDKPKQWLEKITIALGDLIGYAWRFRIVIITLMVFVLVLFVSDQGQDLLISVNGNPFACILFLTTTTLLALLCWHLPKAIDNAKNISFAQFWFGPVDYIPNNSARHERPSTKVDIGRLLGAAAFLVPATGILQTMRVYQIYYLLEFLPPFVLLIAILAFYTIALKHHWIDHFYKNGNTVYFTRYWITMGLLLMPILLIGFLSDDLNRKPYFLAYLSLDLVLLSAAFLITTTLRTCVPRIQHIHIAPFITFGGLFAALVFLAFNFHDIYQPVTSQNRFLTIPLVFCGVGLYLLFSAYLLFVGKKTGITILTFLLIIAYYNSSTRITGYHNVALIKDKPQCQMDSLKAYAQKWLICHREEIAAYPATHKGKDFPVFFVNAYGGGIRAAVWTTTVMGELDRQMRLQRQSDFRHYVFSMSGASGGTVGIGLLSARRAANLKHPEDDSYFYPKNDSANYSHDFLTADIIGLLGRDMFTSFWPSNVNWNDRAKLMESAFEENLKNGIPKLNEPMRSLWTKGNYNLPLMFSNTYDVVSAKKGIAAPVILDSLDFPATILVNQECLGGYGLRMSTAAFISARFPFVSPTGRFMEKYHFTDGGTWENSGAETSLEIMRVFKRVLDTLSKRDTVYRKVKISFLSIQNSFKKDNAEVQPQAVYEPAAPLMGILNTVDGRAKKADSLNNTIATQRTFCYYSIRPLQVSIKTKAGLRLQPVLPLGWQLSEYALKEMQVSVEDKANNVIDTVLVNMGLHARPK